MADLWKSLGSVVGLGVGSIELDVEGRAFTFGDTVRGRLRLELAGPVEAKRLVAVVEATEKRSSWVTDARGARTERTETVSVYRFEQELDRERSYLDESYDFRLPLPSPRSRVELPNGRIGDALRVASAVNQIVRGVSGAIPSWRIHAFLEVPWKVNVKASVDIVVR